MSDPDIITTETEDPDQEYESASEAADDEFEQKLAEERQAISEAVQASAHELEQLAAVRLTGSLGAEISAAATTLASNPREIITRTPAPGSRWSELRGQLETEAKRAEGQTDAKTELLSLLLGHDLFEGMKDVAARDGAAALLTHLVYAAKGTPLPELAASPAAPSVIDLGGRLGAMPDDQFWRIFADGNDGTLATPADLERQLAIMGIAHELQPLGASFAWPSGDAVALQVDELVAAAAADGDGVDLGGLYRRAGTLSMNGQPIPRAIATELVRMAVADIITRAAWGAADARTPTRRVLARFLTAESGTDPASLARNAVRDAARELLASTQPSRVGATPVDEGLRLRARASRGHLEQAFDYTSTRLQHAARAVSGGADAAATLKSLVARSALGDALEAWSDAYRRREQDPATLKKLVGGVEWSASALSAALESTYPDKPAAGSPESLVLTLPEAADALIAEVAFEAAELLLPSGATTTDPLGGPTATADESTLRSQIRASAARAAGEGRLSLFLTANVPPSLRSTPWATTLKTAVAAWTTAETRDGAQVAKAASAFVDALSGVRTTMASSWSPGEAFVAENLVDALASALGAKLADLGATDPTLQAATAKAVADLGGFALKTPVITDMADYWRTTKKAVPGIPEVGLDLAKNLRSWQQAAADPADASTLAAATYAAVDSLVGNRTAIVASAMSDADKAVALRALDDLGTTIAAILRALPRA